MVIKLFRYGQVFNFAVSKYFANLIFQRIFLKSLFSIADLQDGPQAGKDWR